MQLLKTWCYLVYIVPTLNLKNFKFIQRRKQDDLAEQILHAYTPVKCGIFLNV
jgi:hypothetical protein